jgi:hypothetical protein
MRPIDFEASNDTLLKPKDMTDAQCTSLPIHSDGEHCISVWKADWRERLRFLLTGQMWLWVHSGRTQPPVKLSTTAPQWCPADYPKPKKWDPKSKVSDIRVTPNA